MVLDMDRQPKEPELGIDIDPAEASSLQKGLGSRSIQSRTFQRLQAIYDQEERTYRIGYLGSMGFRWLPQPTKTCALTTASPLKLPNIKFNEGLLWEHEWWSAMAAVLSYNTWLLSSNLPHEAFVFLQYSFPFIISSLYSIYLEKYAQIWVPSKWKLLKFSIAIFITTYSYD